MELDGLVGVLDVTTQLISNPQGDLLLYLQARGLTGNGLRIDPAIGSDGWMKLGVMLTRLQSAMQWAWIDWWLYGEKHKYGDLKAITSAPGWQGPSYKRFLNMLSVGRKWGGYQSSRRREVSFSHHEELASLDPIDQGHAMDWVEQTHASTRDLKEYLAQRRSNGQPEPDKEPEVLPPDNPDVQAIALQLMERYDHNYLLELIETINFKGLSAEVRHQVHHALSKAGQLLLSLAEDVKPRKVCDAPKD